MLRLKKNFYDLDGNEVECISCPGYPNMWWVPKEGYTGTIGTHLFHTELAALRAQEYSLGEMKNGIEAKLHGIKHRITAILGN